jgi:hypothetical protein
MTRRRLNSSNTSTFGTGHEGHSTAHQILWAEVQNNGISTSGAVYTDPIVGGSVANCDTGLLESELGVPESTTGSWHGVLSSDPDINENAGANDYSICQITYDLVWKHYSASKLYGTTETAHEVAHSVKDLFEYVTGQGQVDIQGHEYTRYPTGFQSHVNFAVSEIGY